MGVRAYNSWRESKLGDVTRYDGQIFEANLDVVKDLRKEALCYSLCRLIPEVTKIDASDYPGKSLYEIVVSIQKCLNQNDLPWKLIDDPQFLDVRTVLDNVMKERALNNVGVVHRQAEVITYDHENQLWDKGVLGEDTPEKLRDTVLFLLGINLALRVGDEHYDLRRSTCDKRSQLSFERDPKSGKRCLVYREDTVFCFLFFFKIFIGHESFLWGHCYPGFGLLVTSALGFKARVDFSLACFLAYVLVLRFTSGVTPADCIEVSMAAGHIPYMLQK